MLRRSRRRHAMAATILQQRLARWLLMAHDRTDGDELLITQASLSHTLCVYRPSITVVAGILQRAGIIRYFKGNITILEIAPRSIGHGVRLLQNGAGSVRLSARVSRTTV